MLAKNPAYWNAAAVSFQRIEFPIVPDPASQLALYERGDAHVAEVPAAALSRIRADCGFAAELRALGRAGTSFIGLNTQAGPTRDVAFRRGARQCD